MQLPDHAACDFKEVVGRTLILKNCRTGVQIGKEASDWSLAQADLGSMKRCMGKATWHIVS